VKAFKQYIMHKTGDFKKGDLSKWVEIIIKNSIREDQQQHQHTAYDRHAMSKEEEMVDELVALMKEMRALLWNDPESPIDISCGNNCHKKLLRNTIGKIRGDDYRTKNKWEKRLLEFGFIKKIASSQYKILNDGHESLDIKQELQEQKKQEFNSLVKGLK